MGDGSEPTLNMSDSPQNVQMAILVTSGVACLAVLFDVVARYIFRSDASVQEVNQVKRSLEVTRSEVRTDREEATEERLSAELATGLMSEDAGSSYSIRGTPPRANGRSGHLVTSPFRNGHVNGDDGQGDCGLRVGGFALRETVNDLVEAMLTNATVGEIPEDLPDVADNLQTIQELEAYCSKLSEEVDVTAASFVRHPAENGGSSDHTLAKTDQLQTSLVNAQRGIFALRHSWNVLRRLLFCADLHMRNAAAYHTYFYEIEQLKKEFQDFQQQLSDNVKRDQSNGDIAKEIKQLQLFSDRFMMWESAVVELLERARHVVPVHMRTEAVSDPLPVRSICNATTNKMTITEGEYLVLLENDNHRKWKVRNSNGVEDEFPALCLLIPPPDKEALKAGYRLSRSLEQTYSACLTMYEKTLLDYAQRILKTILQNKDRYLRVLHGSSRKRLEDILGDLDTTFSDTFSTLEGFGYLMELHGNMGQAVGGASSNGREDSGLQSDVVEVLTSLLTLLGLHGKLSDKQTKYKNNVLNYASSGSEESDWDTLDDANNASAQDEAGLAISVHEQSTTYGESSSYVSSTGEVRQSFSIRAVLDPRDNSEISMQEAIAKRIINQLRGVYVNPKTREELPIPEAMSKGFILVESSQTRQLRESTQAVGLVAVTITRETRPYTIKKVRDPRSDDLLNVAEAVAKGIFNAEKGIWQNPDTGETLAAKDAIVSGVLIVEYDQGAEESKPEVTSMNMAVFGVLDRKSGKRIPFFEACEKGFIDKEEGMYTDSVSGERIHVVEAAKKGWVNIRKVDDPSRIDQLMQLYTTRSRSGTDSSQSAESTGH